VRIGFIQHVLLDILPCHFYMTPTLDEDAASRGGALGRFLQSLVCEFCESSLTLTSRYPIGQAIHSPAPYVLNTIVSNVMVSSRYRITT
jgi:hypothetical protein